MITKWISIKHLQLPVSQKFGKYIAEKIDKPSDQLVNRSRQLVGLGFPCPLLHYQIAHSLKTSETAAASKISKILMGEKR